MTKKFCFDLMFLTSFFFLGYEGSIIIQHHTPILVLFQVLYEAEDTQLLTPKVHSLTGVHPIQLQTML